MQSNTSSDVNMPEYGTPEFWVWLGGSIREAEAKKEEQAASSNLITLDGYTFCVTEIKSSTPTTTTTINGSFRIDLSLNHELRGTVDVLWLADLNVDFRKTRVITNGKSLDGEWWVKSHSLNANLNKIDLVLSR
jgi:hypothetical protein